MFVLASVLLIWLIKGEQVRKTLDEEKVAEGGGGGVVRGA